MNLRKLQPHLRHGELNAKTLKHLHQIGAVLIRRARVSEIPLRQFPNGAFELAEKLDDNVFSTILGSGHVTIIY